MNHDAYERSQDAGMPVRLFLFRYGEDSIIAYTDQEEPIVIEQMKFDGSGLEEIEYLPTPITRSAVTASGTLDRAPLEVRVSKRSAISKLFNGYPVSSITFLTIREGHRGGDEWVVTWTGRVLSRDLQGAEAVFDCQPTSTSMRRVGLRRHYQVGCPLALYGPQCRADRDAATKTLEVTSASGGRVVVAGGFNDKPLNKYVGGIAHWVASDGQAFLRTIIRAEEGEGIVTFILSGAALVEKGASIAVSYGCGRTMDDCQNLHVPVDEAVGVGGNIKNYGGQPFIPSKNPIGIVNQYY